MLSSLYSTLRFSALALAGLSVLALAGCGGSSSSGGGGASNSGSGGSGSFTAKFSVPQGTNANTADYSAGNVGGGVTPPAPIIGTLLTLTAVTTPSGGFSRQFILVLADTTLTVGKSYPLATETNSLSYLDIDTANNKATAWDATGGTAVLDSISGKTYKFHVTAAPMAPISSGTPGVPGASPATTPGTGTFTVDGSGTANLP